MLVRSDHWLEEAASGLPPLARVPSVRTSALQAPDPLGIIWHWTGGVCRGSGAARALAEEIRGYDRTRDRPASWHVLVAKDGTIYQSVPFNLGSWHCGRPGRVGGKPVKVGGAWDATAWPGGKLFANVNAATVGVELLNSGRLEKVGSSYYCWPYWLNPNDAADLRQPDSKLEVDPSRAVALGSLWYDEYPPAQEQAAQRVLTALVLKYKWGRAASQYGHLHFDPARKEDPGPLWLDVVLPRILDGVFGAE